MSQKVQMMGLVQLPANHARVIISMSISEFYDKIWYGLVDGMADLTNIFHMNNSLSVYNSFSVHDPAQIIHTKLQFH